MDRRKSLKLIVTGAVAAPIAIASCNTADKKATDIKADEPIFTLDRNPDEFVGLPATFMQLGAAGVIGTLWQVDDRATALIDRKSTRLNSSHSRRSRMPSSA